MSFDQQAPLEAHLRNLVISNGPSPLPNDSNDFPRLEFSRQPSHQRNHAHGNNGTEIHRPHQQQLPGQFEQNNQLASGGQPHRGNAKQARTPQKFRRFDEWREQVQIQSPQSGYSASQNVAGNSVQKQPRQYANRGGPAQHSAAYHNIGRPYTNQQPSQSVQRSTPSHFTPLARPNQQQADQAFVTQCQYLEVQVQRVMPELQMAPEEFMSKDSFRLHLEQTIQEALRSYPSTRAFKISLASFGSLASGFGMPGSDMDLALLSTGTSADLPREIEKIILDMGHGARLLTRTRVPIIKVCQQPSTELYLALREERQKWDDMTPEEREKYDHPPKQEEEPAEGVKTGLTTEDQVMEGAKPTRNGLNGSDAPTPAVMTADQSGLSSEAASKDSSIPNDISHDTGPTTSAEDLPTGSAATTELSNTADATRERAKPKRKTWLRERKLGPLDFPKDGVGIQCDINFSNPLGLHNTTLLRCYSHCDVRVRLMVLFVKAWASRRKINSSRDGTLSSYGYVLMVLHYLVNVAQPPVCPNLQLARRQQGNTSSVMVEGCDVQFWRNESEIQQLAAKRLLTHNQEPLGMLLRGFFQYYAQTGYNSPMGGFVWTQEVLSLRTPGGILRKEQKGWTGAKTMVLHEVEVRNRYLFAIEDPFEIEHNVARTVTHNGIVAIRDEFRRAWRILQVIGRAGGEVNTKDGELMERLVEKVPYEESKDAEEGAGDTIVAGTSVSAVEQVHPEETTTEIEAVSG